MQGVLAGRRLGGWIEAMGFVVSIAVLSIVYAIAVEAGAHVTAFILLSTAISGAALVLWVGPGRDGLAIMLAPSSWLLGVLHIVMEGAYCFALITLPPAETSLIVRLSVPVAMATSAIMLMQHPGRIQLAGAALVTAAVLIVIAGFSFPAQLAGTIAAVSCAASVTFRALASELHRWNRAARTITEKLQVTGLLVLVTGLTSIGAVVIAMLLVSAGVMAPNPVVPVPADFVHPPTLILAIVVGAAIFSAMNYLQFSSVVKIGTENLIIASTLMPVATLALQLVASAAGIIKPHAVPWHVLIAMALVVLGSIVVLLGARGR